MYQLRTLGTLDLRASDGHPIHSLLSQPKRSALLAFLGVSAAQGFQRRDRIAAIFWPEHDTEHARHSLRQALHAIRTSLGDRAILTRGDDEVALNTVEVWCDVAELERAFGEQRWADVVELHRGVLLDGFYVPDCGEFEHWLDEQRERVRGRALQAAWHCADACTQRQDASGAIGWGRRALELAPADEDAVLRFMRMAAATGDRAAALQAFEKFAQRLEREYELEPSAETESFARELRAETTSPTPLPVPHPPPPAHTPVAVPDRAPASPVRRPSPRIAAIAAVALLMLVAGWWQGARLLQGEPTPADELPTLMVLPFTDATPKSQYSYLAVTLAPELVAHLKSARLNAITPAEGVARRSDVPFDYTVGGTVVSGGARIRVLAQLVDARTAEVVDTVAVERDSADVLSLVHEVVTDVGEGLRRKLGRAVRIERWRGGTENSSAYALLLRAYELRQQAHLLEDRDNASAAQARLATADSMLAQALALDPDYFEALVQRAQLARKRALSLEILGSPFLADSILHEGELAAVRACKVQPGNSRAFEALGNTRKERVGLLPTRPRAELLLRQARADLERAVRLDPRNMAALHPLADLYAKAGDIEAALTTLGEAYDVDTYQEGVPTILIKLFDYSFELGQDSLAEKYCSELRSRTGGTPVTRSHCELHLAAWSTLRGPPSIDAAWNELQAASSGGLTYRGMRARLLVLVAGVIARAGEADSARAVLARARAMVRPDTLPLLHDEAGVRVLLKDYEIGRALFREWSGSVQSPMLMRSRRVAVLRDT